MIKLSKEQLQRKAEHIRLLDEGRKKLQKVIDEQNERLCEVRAAIDEARDEYNGLVVEAQSFVVEVHDEMQEYYDNKSEKWQEGDNGSAFSSWMDQWDNELDELDIAGPDDIELDDRDNCSMPLEEYPNSVDEV